MIAGNLWSHSLSEGVGTPELARQKRSRGSRYLMSEATAAGQRKILSIALALNAAMFVIGIAAGIFAQSSGLVADALDMLADAFAYAIALLAVNRTALFKSGAASASGIILLILGAGVLLDAGRRGYFGSAPDSGVMIAVATLSLCVNFSVLYMLGRHQDRNEIHLRASFIFTRADVVANCAVIFTGTILLFSKFRYLDLLVGAAIGLYIIREALEILAEAREARQARLP
jgi:cation diffusion facilitator family transporter